MTAVAFTHSQYSKSFRCGTQKKVRNAAQLQTVLVATSASSRFNAPTETHYFQTSSKSSSHAGSETFILISCCPIQLRYVMYVSSLKGVN